MSYATVSEASDESLLAELAARSRGPKGSRTKRRIVALARVLNITLPKKEKAIVSRV